MNKIIESPLKLGVIIRNLMNLFRARKNMANIKADGDGGFSVVEGNVVIVEHCPIIELNDDKRCIEIHCPFNDQTQCSEVEPGEPYADFRP
jgi:hypothetical protein